MVIAGNSAAVIASNGSVCAAKRAHGASLRGTINGITQAPAPNPETYNGQPYYPFNLDNLNISAVPAGTPAIQALAIGQDNSDLVGGNGPPTPDGIQDLHIVLTGLNPSATIASLVVIDNTSGEQWTYASSSSPQMVSIRSAGSGTADLFLAPTAAHSDDPFDDRPELMRRERRSRFPCPAFSSIPSCPCCPRCLSAPLGVTALATTATQVTLSWAPSPGASDYVVELAAPRVPRLLDDRRQPGRHDLHRFRPELRDNVRLHREILINAWWFALQRDGRRDDE